MTTFVSVTVNVVGIAGTIIPHIDGTENDDILLDLKVHSKEVKETRRDGVRGIRRTRTATSARKHRIRFPEEWFESDGMMKQVLRRVLGQAVSGLSLEEFAKLLKDHVGRTSERHLVAEIEVVRVKVLGSKGNGAIRRLKNDCGFCYRGQELGTCSVCLKNLSGDLIRTPSCSHHYHPSCILTWLEKKNSCPLCRTKIL